MTVQQKTIIEQALGNTNFHACLAVIRACEGTAGEGGYSMLFGGKHFLGDKHPDIKANYTDKAGRHIITTAAGAYQITHTTYLSLIRLYMLPDCFTPDCQDRLAAFLLLEVKAIDAAIKGDLKGFIDKARSQWASLPNGVGYQPEKTYDFCLDAFQKAGGVLCSL
jgi:muramidase (phage lysozyme)